mmetsp:Transcript_97832/g.169436  ORF Transcript_97832/g.169436 Transcript_97832/m.169436 type:complete len:93 (+) Transcript_97832:330-608(+)
MRSMRGSRKADAAGPDLQCVDGSVFPACFVSTATAPAVAWLPLAAMAEESWLTQAAEAGSPAETASACTDDFALFARPPDRRCCRAVAGGGP